MDGDRIDDFTEERSKRKKKKVKKESDEQVERVHSESRSVEHSTATFQETWNGSF